MWWRRRGGSILFSLKPIMVELEGESYIGLILPISLADLVIERRSAGGSYPKGGGSCGGGGCGGNKKTLPKVDAMRGPAQVRVHYEAHLPSLSLRDWENLWSILEGVVLPTLNSHIL